MNRELECVMDKSQTFSCFIVVNRAVPTHTFWSNEHNTFLQESLLTVFPNGTISLKTAWNHKGWETVTDCNIKLKTSEVLEVIKSSEIGEGCHMDWLWLFLCLRLKIVDISISCKNSINQIFHQYPSPALRVVYLTAAVLGKQCENKRVMKRPMSTRLKNILAALPDIISIRGRRREWMRKLSWCFLF